MPNSRFDDPELRARHVQRLSEFVLRARRVEAHSIAQDRQRLRELSQATVTVQYEVEPKRTILIRQFPPEEQLESAAARVRPFLLQKDRVHHKKVIEALGFLLHGRTETRLTTVLDELRERWDRFDPRGTDILAYSLQTFGMDGSSSSDAVADNVLAFAWIYGDVVHADADRLAGTEHLGIEGRYEAATLVVAQLVVASIMTLGFIRELQELGAISLPPEVFEQQVVVTRTEFRQEVKLIMREADGTAPPPVGVDPSLFGWEPLGPDSFRPSGDQA